MVSQDPGFWDLGPECINGYFALRAQVSNTIMLIEGLGPEHNYFFVDTVWVLNDKY